MSGFEKSMELFHRAASVIPAGIYGHQSPALSSPGAFPYYGEKGKGCRYWDVDGNEFIDYMCGYGPILLGYGHEKVDEAVRKQMEKGDCFNHPTGLMVELAERMVDRIPWADWAVFGKNGSDMTTWAVTVARAFTRNPKIFMVKGEYHGAHAWCVPSTAGILPEDREHVHTFPWNDLDGLQSLFEKYPGKVAGVIMTPYHHPVFADSAMPEEGFWAGARDLCDRHGALLILDDVRAGFRLDLRCSSEAVKAKPHLATFSKAMGNGYPISSCVGDGALKAMASKVFLTGSFWNSGSSMAATMACLDEMDAVGAVEIMETMGQRLMDGMTQLAVERGLSVKFTGPPAMPFFRFSNESNFKRTQLFCVEMVKRGVFFHPSHNWFVCAAHREKDIDETLDRCVEAFDIVRDEFGS